MALGGSGAGFENETSGNMPELLRSETSSPRRLMSKDRIHVSTLSISRSSYTKAYRGNWVADGQIDRQQQVAQRYAKANTRIYESMQQRVHTNTSSAPMQT